MARRVLQLITGITVGGAENHLLTLCEGLVERGHDVTVAYLKGEGELREAFEAAGCTVVAIDIGADADPLGLARLLGHVRGEEYDVIHGHLFHGTVYGAAVAALTRDTRFVVSKHNDHPFWDEQPYRTIHDLAMTQADRVVCLSEHVRQYLLETTRVAPGDVETIHYGLDPAPFDEVPPETVASVRSELSGNGPLVGTVGRLTEQKDFPVLVRAFGRVSESVPDARLAVVGRGEEKADLRALTRRLGIEDRVTFTGFREDIPALMHAFDVFALPSRWEGFGVVFLEAMAAGTPIVASDTSAIPEVVGRGDDSAGRLVEPGDVAG
ncbi:glycosyltransferase, partial [Halapricum sp. CBA1109]|uniref:glycosyltransferase n=1 Tax=Halapricum sp. CBA1109 TaxID=2668068 RepID=UPI0012FA4B0D